MKIIFVFGSGLHPRREESSRISSAWGQLLVAGIGLALTVALSAPPLQGQIIVTQPPAPFADAICGCGSHPPTPGETDLLPLQWKSSGQICANWAYYWLQVQSRAVGWSFSFPAITDPGLSASVTISTYEALHSSRGPYCRHGADIDVTVSGVSGLAEGQFLDWVQLFRFEGDSASPVPQSTPGWNIDPDTRWPRYANEDQAPFYYNQQDYVRLLDENAPYAPDNPITAANEERWLFQDEPGVGNFEQRPHSGEMEFLLMLVSWDRGANGPQAYAPGLEEDPRPITIYGGLEWGFHYNCVPEPSVTGLAAGVALLVLIGARRRWGGRSAP